MIELAIRVRCRVLLGVLLFCPWSVGCKSSADVGAAELGIAFPPLYIQHVSTRAMVADQMRAAIEMQLSGEPLATSMGRDIATYLRYSPTPDVSEVLTPQGMMVVVERRIDPVGFSTAVESYEYSKMAMNHLSFESGAGLSLMYGPRLNPMGLAGSEALGLLRLRIQTLALASRAGSTGTLSPWVVVPAPADNPLNRLGFPGLWPEFAEFRSYDPTLAPSRDAQTSCTSTGANGGVYGVSAYGGMGKILLSDYECSDNTLHLVNRDSQVEKVLAIDALGLAAWKQALWIINYFQFVHDTVGRSMIAVEDTDLSQVGQPGNTVQASDGDLQNLGQPGTYLGSTDLEGFQGLVMMEEIDNKGELLLKQLMTTDGSSFSGFTNLKAALGYDYMSPLRYFPHAISVTEQPGTAGAESQPVTFTIQDGVSQLSDLTALIGAYSEVFALTDINNSQVGGSSTVRPLFDGDPFPADNGLADGEQTPHDRALAILKVALVNLDRLHVDPQTGVVCDSARLTGSGVSRSAHTTTVEVVYALVALRAAYRALTSQLTLYSDATPDGAALHTALDGTSMAGAPGGATILARLRQLLTAQTAFLNTKLVNVDGQAVNGYDVVVGAADSTLPSLESQAAAVRGLLEAYLVTGQTDLRDRALKAYSVLEGSYYHPTLRIYRPTIGEETSFVFTPARFGIVQSALRQMYILIGARPGNDALRAELEERIGRLNKLVLNGWDDRNGNHLVDYPDECAYSAGGMTRGGLQMGERALTGELGTYFGALFGEFDRDCVPNLSWVNLPATLAAEIQFAPAK